MYLEYQTPGPPYHPADYWLAKVAHERRMREIVNLDIDEWVNEQIKCSA